MAYPPSQPQSSLDLQAEYTKLLARTGALFYQIKDLKARLPALEAQLTACEGQKADLEAQYAAAVEREKADAAPATSLQEVEAVV